MAVTQDCGFPINFADLVSPGPQGLETGFLLPPDPAAL